MTKIARAALAVALPVVCVLSFTTPRVNGGNEPVPPVPSSQEVLSAQHAPATR